MRPAIVVVSYRTPERLTRCLDAIVDDAPEASIYVADNASDSVALASMLNRFPRAVGLPDAGNRGFAAGVNRGVERAFADGATHALVLNDDVFLYAGAIGQLVEAAGDAGAAAPYLAGRPGGEFHGGYIDWTTGVAGHAVGARDYLCAACLMISRRGWETAGPFDESYFLYYEDVDWSVRAAERGVMLTIVPRELAWHEGGASTGGSTDPVAIYWWTRNRLRFVRRHRGYRRGVAVAGRSVVRSARRTVHGASGGPLGDGRASGRGAFRARLRGLASGLLSRLEPPTQS